MLNGGKGGDVVGDMQRRARQLQLRAEQLEELAFDFQRRGDSAAAYACFVRADELFDEAIRTAVTPRRSPSRSMSS